jgi:2-furoyl-CoA dehydrogenase FAD binding subunit
VAVVADAQGMRVAVGGLGDRPHASELPPLAGDALDDALNELAWSLDVRDDPHTSAATRRHLLRRLARQAIQQARRPA